MSMRSQPTPHFERKHIIVDISLLRDAEAYLGDRPSNDKRAIALHDLIVRVLAAQGLV
jgi:hypothetical protein